MEDETNLKHLTPENVDSIFQNRFDSFLQLKSNELSVDGQPFDKYCKSMDISDELPHNLKLSILRTSNETRKIFLSKKITTSNISKNGIPLTKQYFIQEEIDYFLTKKKDINAMEDEAIQIDFYLTYLSKKCLEFKNPEPQHETKTNTPTQKENQYNEYFRGNTFLLFKGYCDEYNIDNTCRTDLRVLYELINNDGFFVDTMELKHYLKFLKLHLKYDTTELKKINLNIKPNIKRTNDYKRIKDNLKLTLK